MATKGRCAICGRLGALTEDHVPPKSVVPPDPVLVRRLADTFIGVEERRDPRPSFRAAGFTTICTACNSDRLGSVYDPALARFANEFASWVRAAFALHLSLPSEARIRLQPALVARAVIGHLLAAEPAKRDRYDELGGNMPIAMRQYFLSEELALPSSIQLYVWPYPSSTTVIGRGIGHLDAPAGSPIVIDVLKFFPVGFGVVGIEPRMPGMKAVQIRPELAADINAETEIAIPLRDFPPVTWPERPQGSGIVLVHKDRVITIDRDRDRAS